MINQLFQLTNLIGMLVAAVFAVIYFRSKGRQDNQNAQTKDSVETIEIQKNLLEALRIKQQQDKETSDRMTAETNKKTTENLERIRTLEKQVQELQSANKTLSDVLLGRDKDGSEYMRQGMEAIKRTQDIYDLLIITNKNVEKLYSVIAEHLKIIEQKV